MGFLTEGFPTTVGFAADATVKFKEITVTPPAVDGGGENDTTTMRNTGWRTRQPKKLKTLTNAQMTVSYDPAIYDDILALVNVNTLITLTFSNGDTVAFWGWLDKFTPGEIREGSQPTATIVLVASNQNGSGVETAPVYTAAP